ncbi:toxin-antitoxin system TumE family protein, partial [Microcystis aeruginosa]
QLPKSQNTDTKPKIKYRYHYMNEAQVMIFRYDK